MTSHRHRPASGTSDPLFPALGRLRSDRRRGARALSIDALATLADRFGDGSERSESALPSLFRKVARSLELAQPSMGPFLRWGADWRGMSRSGKRGRMLREARSWLMRERARLRSEPDGLKLTSRQRFPDVREVVTLSRSQSVLDALFAPGRIRRRLRVSVLESLPGGEGREFAKDLRAAGLTARVIPDAQGVEAVKAADLLILGADAIFSDGSVIHKVGTRSLARTASRAGVPVIVVAGRSKFTGRPAPHRALPPRFDRTPSRWISEVWTDAGVRRSGRRSVPHPVRLTH